MRPLQRCRGVYKRNKVPCKKKKEKTIKEPSDSELYLTATPRPFPGAVPTPRRFSSPQARCASFADSSFALLLTYTHSVNILRAMDVGAGLRSVGRRKSFSRVRIHNVSTTSTTFLFSGTRKFICTDLCDHTISFPQLNDRRFECSRRLMSIGSLDTRKPIRDQS